MILHVTRHGQTDVRSDHPPGDPHLTQLGRKQAELLGEALKDQGFEGQIYSSPYFRTIETADVVAEVTDTVVFPAAEMREYVIRENQMDGFEGATQAALVGRYDRVKYGDGFPYPWWTTNIESDEDIELRVTPLVDRAMAGDVDVLLVGHGASVAGVHRYVLGRYAPDQMTQEKVGWNCLLSSFRIRPKFDVIKLLDVSHLSEDMITSNAKTRAEVLAERGK